MAGRSASDIPYQEGLPNLRLEHHTAGEANLRDAPPTQSFARVECVDPLSVAAKFAGAAMGPQHKFRMMDANGNLECPLVDAHFQEWKLPPRKVQRKGCNDWRMGLRLGPTASGASTNYARYVTGAPRGRRKTTVQELFFLVPRAALVSTQLWPPMRRSAYRSAAAAMNLREAEKFALIHSVGPTSRAYSAPRTDLARRAKVGYYPRCALSTHAAHPPTYALGDSNPLKARGLPLWKTDGPWAVRRVAAFQYGHTYSAPSELRDPAARTLIMPVPGPLPPPILRMCMKLRRFLLRNLLLPCPRWDFRLEISTLQLPNRPLPLP